MKRYFQVLICVFLLTANYILSSNEQINTTNFIEKSFQRVLIPPDLPDYLLKNNYDLPQSTSFQIFDSIANAYSYFSESQQPFVYIPEIGILVTIKRGYWDIDRYPEYQGNDTKNNLFIRYSTNWGLTWTNPILVYRVQSATQYFNWFARYPSVYAFSYEGDIAFVYTAPCTNGSGWIGFVNGLYYQYNSFQSYSKSFTWKDGNRYNWGGTDSRIVGGMDGGDPYSIAVGTLMIEGGLPLSLTSHLGYRKTNDFDKWTEVIPPQWEANKFKVPVSTEDSVRTSAIAGFKFANDGNLYMAAYANFANHPLNRFFFGVSKSTDLGKTWSDFDIAPAELFDSYLQQYGLSIEVVTWSLPQFVPLGNDDYSFLVNINEDTTRTFRLYSDALHQLVEVYKQSGIWGVRKITDLTGYVLAYVAPTGSNQLGEESQLVQTEDGKYLLAKWVDFVDVVIQDTLYKNATTDIFVAVRPIKSNIWTSIKNITNSLDFDRITWVPDKIPSNMTNIPIIKLESIPIPGQDPTEARLRQRMLDTVPQYVMLGFFDAADILSSEERSYTTSDIYNLNVYPNPADGVGYIEFFTESPVSLSVDLYDVFGRKIMNLFKGNTFSGIQSIPFKTLGLSSGTYYVVLESNGNKYSKQINILK